MNTLYRTQEAVYKHNLDIFIAPVTRPYGSWEISRELLNKLQNWDSLTLPPKTGIFLIESEKNVRVISPFKVKVFKILWENSMLEIEFFTQEAWNTILHRWIIRIEKEPDFRWKIDKIISEAA